MVVFRAPTSDDATATSLSEVAVPSPRREPDARTVDVVDPPMLAPVVPELSWSWIHELSQSRLTGPGTITQIRRTATIQPGTRMLKLLSPRQLAAVLGGRRPSGFCYRSFDVAPITTMAGLSMLTGDESGMGDTPVVFGLRWRAVDQSDYDIPFAGPVDDLPHYAGLVPISPHHRLGPPVLGTGFAPSGKLLIPEFVTADLADLPLGGGTSLVAFTPDGTEVTLYLYLPEQRAWTRMFGPQWRHLMAGVPDVAPEQEFVPTADYSGGSALVGTYRGDVFEAVADPPHEYRVLARARAARYPVESLARRLRYTTWRGHRCTLVRVDGDWTRVRLTRPEPQNVADFQCIERGIYEAWAGAAELQDSHDHDHPY